MTMRDLESRRDLSDKVIHFTRGESPDHAFSVLRKIIAQRRLIAGAGMIRGGYPCVCFTEAPLPILADGFSARLSRARYSPFGLMFPKSWVFARGGRPVIYRPDCDFAELPEGLRWKHVRYEIGNETDIDFTWEREWRIRCDALAFGPGEATVVLPNREWWDLLADIHETEQEWIVEAYATVLDREIAESARAPFRWEVVTLG
jgi:hypothetical protein